MKLSENGKKLLMEWEGFCNKAYKCVATEKYYTIGFGHYGKDVSKGMTITRVEAEKLLESDLVSFEGKVEKYNDVYHWSQNQFDAMVLFAYNVGSIDKLTNNGKRSIEEISKKMLGYNKSEGKVLTGLTNRRLKEQAIFNTKEIKASDVINCVKLVIDGKYGCGIDRKKKLEKEGFNYSKIQEIVNLVMKYPNVGK